MVFLGIQTELPITATGAADPEPGLAGLGADDADADIDDEASVVVQVGGNAVDVQVFRLRACARNGAVPLAQELGEHAARGAEQDVCLVDKVSTKVIDRGAAALQLELAFPAPGSWLLGSVAVEVRIEFNDATNGPIRNELLHCQEIAVPPAVLVDAEQAALLAGEVDQGLSLGAAGNEGLLDEHVLPGLEGLAGEGEVRLGWSSDDDDVERGVGKEVVERGEVFDAGVIVGRR